MSNTTNIPSHYRTCPETGLFVESYISSYYGDWEPELPAGFVVFDDRIEAPVEGDDLKWHENCRIRRIGPRDKVLAASVSMVEGVAFIPACA